jgi:hypothetical protein
MFRHRQRVFRRKTRRRIASVSLLAVLALFGAFAGRAIQEELSPRLTFAPTATAYAADQHPSAVEASAVAQVTQDLPMLEDLWGVGGGPALGVRYVEAPRGIRAGMPLRVSIHGDQLDGKPFVGGLVEISWRLGDAVYRDVTYTDQRGNVDVSRDLDPSCEGKPCMVGVRMYKGTLQSLAYTKFTPK